VKAFVSEYFRNTNGPRDFLLAKVNYDELYATWCEEQAAHMAERQNYIDEGITSLRIRGEKIQYKFYTPREYDVLVQSRRMSLRGETGPFTESHPQRLDWFIRGVYPCTPPP